MNIYETLLKYEPKGIHNQVPIVWKDAFRHKVYDFKFKSYIDFTSGIFTANVGHSYSTVVAAIIEQSRKLLHSGLFANEPRAHLVRKLAKISGMDKVFLMSSGGEAVEAAIRFMRAYTGRGGVWGLKGAFHGRSAGCLAIEKWILSPIKYDGDTPRLPYFGDEKPAGLFIESYFGYNAQFHDKAWIQDLCAEAKRHNVLVCFDEIQAGFGRTGKMFGFEHYDVTPDMIVVGKGLSSSLPISAVLGRADILDSIETDLTSTHTGNPVCCAAALASIKVLEDEGLIEKARMTGDWIEVYLRGLFPNHKIWGKGMVWAIDLEDTDFANRVVDRCAEKGLLLVKTHRGTIKVAPPLLMPMDLMEKGLQIIREAIDDDIINR